MEIVTLAAIDL